MFITRPRLRVAPVYALLLLLAAAPRASAQGRERLGDRIAWEVARQLREAVQRRVGIDEAPKVGADLERSLGRLLRLRPESEALCRLYCEQACALAFAFKEEEDPEGAAALYLEAEEAAARQLRRLRPGDMARLERTSPEEAEAILRRWGEAEVPCLFWYAFARGLRTDLLRETGLIADVPRLAACLRWLVARAPSFFHGGPHLALGVLQSILPPAAGRDLGAARAHFDEVERLTGGRWLLAKVLRGRTFSVALQSELPPDADLAARQAAARRAWEDFLATLGPAAEAPDGLWPARELYNAVSREKARRLLEAADDLILLPPDVDNPYARD